MNDDTTMNTAAATMAFKDYMSVPSGDNFHNFLGVLDDSGIPITISDDDFLSCESAESDMHMLRDELGFWALWMDAKLKGFEALRDEGFEAIKATADLSGRVYHIADDAKIWADWCRRDGICYVQYASMVQTAVASRAKTKRRRDIEDTEQAERALELMYEHHLEA